MSEALRPEDTRDALRKVGIVLFAIGALMLFFRKSQDWGDFALFLILAIPAAALYGGGVLTLRDTGGLRPWQGVASVLGLIFVPLALFELIDLVGATPSAFDTFWVFGVTAALAGYAGLVAGIRFHLLAGAVALIISWSALWDMLLGNEGIGGHIGIYRGVLGILSILLIVAGIRAWRSAHDENEGLLRFSELLTGAGIAALIACALGVTSVAGQYAALTSAPLVETSTVWDVLLLAVSVGLVAIGAQLGTRGPVYVGAIGLALFVFIVGLDLNDSSPEPTKLGLWPLVLLIGGGAAIAASLSRGVSLGDGPKDLVRRIGG